MNMNRRRVDVKNYKTGAKGARCAAMALSSRWGWIVECKDPMGWSLVKPYPMDDESKRLLALF